MIVPAVQDSQDLMDLDVGLAYWAGANRACCAELPEPHVAEFWPCTHPYAGAFKSQTCCAGIPEADAADQGRPHHCCGKLAF